MTGISMGIQEKEIVQEVSAVMKGIFLPLHH